MRTVCRAHHCPQLLLRNHWSSQHNYPHTAFLLGHQKPLSAALWGAFCQRDTRSEGVSSWETSTPLALPQLLAHVQPVIPASQDHGLSMRPLTSKPVSPSVCSTTSRSWETIRLSVEQWQKSMSDILNVPSTAPACLFHFCQPTSQARSRDTGWQVALLAFKFSSYIPIAYF